MQTPNVINISATLNIGIAILNIVNDIKSITYPNNNLSIKLPDSPPSNKPNAKVFLLFCLKQYMK